MLPAPLTSSTPPPPPFPALPRSLQLGTYDPLPYVLDQTKEVRLKVDRIKYWLSVGAQPSERVSYLLWRSGVIPAPPVRFSPSKAISKEKAKEAAGGKLQ
jgi:ribosomal protein S16